MSAATVPDGPPRMAGLLAAYVIDALGSGLWLPFALIFFTRAQGLSLTAAGFAMSVGSLLGLGVWLLSGGVIDRLGPHRLIIAATFVRAAVFAVFPLVHSWWLMSLGVFLVSASDRVFSSANVPLLRTGPRPPPGRRKAARLPSTVNSTHSVGCHLAWSVVPTPGGRLRGFDFQRPYRFSEPRCDRHVWWVNAASVASVCHIARLGTHFTECLPAAGLSPAGSQGPSLDAQQLCPTIVFGRASHYLPRTRRRCSTL